MAWFAAAAPYLISAAGAGASAYGVYASGQAQEKAYEFNAQVAEEEAAAARVQAEYEEEQARTRLKQLIGTQRILYAKAGVDLGTGSPLMILADTAAKGEADLEMIRYGGDVAVAQARNAATLARFYGSSASSAGTISSIGTGVSGLSNAYIGYAGNTLPASDVGTG